MSERKPSLIINGQVIELEETMPVQDMSISRPSRELENYVPRAIDPIENKTAPASIATPAGIMLGGPRR